MLGTFGLIVVFFSMFVSTERKNLKILTNTDCNFSLKIQRLKDAI